MSAGVVLVLSGCADGGKVSEDAAAVVLPPEGVDFDYQLGGAYDPAGDTGIVVRDSTAVPAPGLYTVCYVNGFQTQPGDVADEARGEAVDDRGGEPGWEGIVLVVDGQPVVDPEWPDEFLLDTRSAARRQQIANRLAPVVAGCAAAGFDAVEFDNLDSYTRSRGALTLADNTALAQLLSAAARANGLAVAQKNTPEAVAGSADLFDFAITEDCGAFDECDVYGDAYDVVLDVEYAPAADFADLCRARAVPGTAIRRDRGLVPSWDDAHVLERCGSPA